jgi:hypothetical protein
MFAEKGTTRYPPLRAVGLSNGIKKGRTESVEMHVATSHVSSFPQETEDSFEF